MSKITTSRQFLRAILKTLGTIVLSCGLSVLSFYYQQPPNCTSYCAQPPCKVGQCQSIMAGFPLPFIFDDTGGSPVSGWGKMGIEDLQNFQPLLFMLDIAFYSLILIAIFKAYYLFKQRRRQKN